MYKELRLHSKSLKVPVMLMLASIIMPVHAQDGKRQFFFLLSRRGHLFRINRWLPSFTGLSKRAWYTLHAHAPGTPENVG